MAMKEKLAALDASRRDGVQYRKASWFDLIISSANAGTGMCFYLLMTYASYIGTQGYGITTAMVGMILTGMRIFDGVTDALFAAFFEKMPARFGKIRIFMIGGWALTGISVITMYSWAAGKFEGAAGWRYLSFPTCFTFLAIPSMAWGEPRLASSLPTTRISAR